MRAHFGDKVYETVIPRNVRVSEAPSFGKPALIYDLKCAGSQAYLKLARELVGRERERLKAGLSADRCPARAAVVRAELVANERRPARQSELRRMAEGRRGLGRGLSALLDEVEAPAGGPARAPGVTEIPIELIKANPDQPRRHFDEAELEELAAVDPREGRAAADPGAARPVFAGEYQIVAGERRWRAAQRAGRARHPGPGAQPRRREVLEIAIVENVQRADLSPIEEAEGYRALIDRFGRTQAQVADTVGKSRVHVANALRLLQLPDGGAGDGARRPADAPATPGR